MTKNTQVVHCKKSPYDIYIGRPSIWGNPFNIGKDGTRDEVILKYGSWLFTQNGLIDRLIDDLQGKILGCWCRPEHCHGDVLAAVADGRVFVCNECNNTIYYSDDPTDEIEKLIARNPDVDFSQASIEPICGACARKEIN